MCGCSNPELHAQALARKGTGIITAPRGNMVKIERLTPIEENARIPVEGGMTVLRDGRIVRRRYIFTSEEPVQPVYREDVEQILSDDRYIGKYGLYDADGYYDAQRAD